MKYIIDTDPGIDDAIAICLALKNNLDVIGFTLATGNVKPSSSEENLKTILDVNSSKAKIYKGTITNESSGYAHFAHGDDGLGNNFFPKSNRPTEDISAEDFIINSTKENAGNISIICLGPLTNLASALKKDPSITNYVNEVIIMGMSYDEQATERYKEFNLKVDVPSAKIVLESPFKKIRMVTHEVGALSYIEKDYMDDLVNAVNPVTHFVYLISRKYIEFSKEHNNIIGLSTPDPTTVASVIDPSIVTFIPCTCRFTEDDCYLTKTNYSNMYVSVDFDLEKFRNLFKNTFR